MVKKKNKKIKFAVVGCGAIGERHIAVIDADSRAELSAICDTNREKCKFLSEKYGGVPYFTDYKKMLKETEADIFNICTPNNLHAEMAIEVAKAGKNILVEKPMSIFASDARKMIEVAKKNGVKLMIVKQNRFNAPIVLVQKAIAGNKLGKIFMAKADVLWNRNQEYYSSSNWHGEKEMEGGALYTQVSHFIDLLIWWLGDVKETQAAISTKNHDIEIEDCGSAILRFENGTIGNLKWTTCVYGKNYEGSITIIGEKGTIKIGGKYLNNIEFWDVPLFPLPENILFEDKPNNYGKYQGTSSNHHQVMESVIDELLGKKHNVVFGEEGLKTVEAIEKIYKNAKIWK